MGWAKLDDRRHQNPKLREAGLAASGLDAYAITYCAANETDGFVSKDVVSMLASCKRWTQIAQKLVHVNRWEWDEERQGWWIHDYLDYNPSKAETQAKRAAESARQRANVQKRWGKRDTGGIPVVSERYRDLNSPDPFNSVSKDTELVNDGFETQNASPKTPKKRPTKRLSPIPENFEVTPEMRRWASENVHSNVDRETDKFVDYWRANGATKLDWVATWRNWMRRADERQPASRPKTANGFFEMMQREQEGYRHDSIVDLEV